jgi:hypothetical protein
MRKADTATLHGDWRRGVFEESSLVQDRNPFRVLQSRKEVRGKVSDRIRWTTVLICCFVGVLKDGIQFFLAAEVGAHQRMERTFKRFKVFH